MARAYGWSLRDMDVPAGDVAQHWIVCRVNDIAERQWSLSVSAYPHMDARGRKLISGSLNVEMSRLLGKDGVTSADYGREDRIRIIGGALRSRSRAEWESRHRHDLQWLASEGVTIDAAIEAATAMHEAAVLDAQRIACL